MFFYGLYIFQLPIILMKRDKQKDVSVVSFINMLIMIALNIVFINYYGYFCIAYVFLATYFLMFVPIRILT